MVRFASNAVKKAEQEQWRMRQTQLVANRTRLCYPLCKIRPSGVEDNNEILLRAQSDGTYPIRFIHAPMNVFLV
jgi:hypothetical protein